MVEHHIAFLSLGSNIENKLNNLKKALSLLAENKINIEKISSVYETEPVGYKEQNNFYNIVVKIITSYPPEKLLHIINNIESQMGRKREIHWGPRNIDIDIIFFDNKIINLKNLIIPHKEMHNRKFVLIPLIEIEPDFIHPVFNATVSELLEKTSDTGKVLKTDIKIK